MGGWLVYGWMGKMLEVDLTSGSIEERELTPTLAEGYLGGRGVGARLVYDMVQPTIDPYDPTNILVFATGPLTGTCVPTAGRSSLSTRSPLTGTILDCNAGGAWGVRLKQTGYDVLIIRGKAPQPVYLSIKDGQVRLEGAIDIWGKDTATTSAELVAREGKGGSILSIGPAGENRVRFASIAVDGHRFFGRGGAGAVMGSKGLKAIYARGDSRPQIADPELLDFVVYETDKVLKANPITSKGLPEFGTAVLVNIMHECGALPVRNFQDNTFATVEMVSGEALERRLVRRSACWGCPIACGREVTSTQGVVHGPEYESLWSLGPDCGIDDLEMVIAANELCNKLGLDTISTGATIACAMELSQLGLLKEEIPFGNREVVLHLIESIAYRTGLGDQLAEGSMRLAESFGVPQLAMHVKGLELPAYDPRAMKGQGLAFATSNRGGCHLRANMLGPEVLGSPKMVDRFAYSGKAGLVIVIQNAWAVLDSLVLCKFTSFAVDNDYYARLLTAVVGEEYRAQDLQQIGERIFNLERLYNLRVGFTGKDDTLPERLVSQPHASGPARGQCVELTRMLQEYYRFRGWDSHGVPTSKKAGDLGLEEEVKQVVPGV